MRWLHGFLVLALVATCGHEAEKQSVGSAGAVRAGATTAGSAANGASGSAGPSAAQIAAWEAAGFGSAVAGPDWPPSIIARHDRAERICPAVTPYFYEVAKDGKVSHLLGTRHIGVPFAKLPDVVHEALAKAKLAVFEIAPDDKSEAPEQDEPIREELGSADWAHYTDLVGPRLAHMLERGSTTQATLALEIGVEDMTATLDKEIEDAAGSANIPMLGLETAAFQDGVLAKLLDLRMLKASIETTADRAEIDRDSAKELGEFCAGVDEAPGTDAETRAKLEHAGYTAAEIDAQDDLLVYSRNRAWIPKLEELFARGDVFVAVGADHLIGDTGVIALLRADGYTTKRITR